MPAIGRSLIRVHLFGHAGLFKVPIYKLGSSGDRVVLSGLSQNWHKRQNPCTVAVLLFRPLAPLRNQQLYKETFRGLGFRLVLDFRFQAW
jgi:hypothetical protein